MYQNLRWKRVAGELEGVVGMVVPRDADPRASSAAVLSASVRTWKTRLRRFLVCFVSVITDVHLEFRNHCHVINSETAPQLSEDVAKILKSLSQDAELAEIERIRLARRMKGGGSRASKAKVIVK